MKKKRYVLVDSFKGGVSDFADEVVYSIFGSRKAAVKSIVQRISLIYGENPDQFGCLNTDDIERHFVSSDSLKIFSADGCEYMWKMCLEV